MVTSSGTVRLRLSPTSILRAVLIVGVWALVSAIVLRATHPLVNFLEAAVIAALSRPVVVRMGRRMPEWLAVVLLTVGILVAVLLTAAVVILERRQFPPSDEM